MKPSPFNLPRLRIVSIIPSLTLGGSERVLVTLLKRWAELETVEAHLLVLHAKDNQQIDDIPAGVSITVLGASKTVYSLAAIRRYLNAHKPDVVFSTSHQINRVIGLIRATLLPQPVFVARENILPGFVWRHSTFQRQLIRLGYRSLDHIICQSDAMRNDIETNFGIRRSRLSVIVNPVDLDKIQKLAAAPLPFPFPPGHFNLLALGRLEAVKRFDLAVDAMSRLTDQNITLTIVGHGSQKKHLEEKIGALGLDERVRLFDRIKNPYPLLAKADALLITSEVEAFPNVALESIACGTPVLGTPMPGGLADLARQSQAVILSSTRDASDLATLIESNVSLRSKWVDPTALEKHRDTTVAKEMLELFVKLKRNNNCALQA